MENVVFRLNEILENKKDCKICIINDKLTLSVFNVLRKNLKNVKEINFILRNKKSFDSDELIREFEIEVNDVLFNTYDVVQKNKLTHFNESKQMYDFIEKNVNIRMSKVDIGMNLIIVDNDFLIIGSSSLEIDNSKRKNKRINFDVALDEVKNNTQIIDALNRFDTIWHSSEYTIEYKSELLEMLRGVFKENSPEFLYYFTLYELFGNKLDSTIERFESDNLNFKKSEIWGMLYNFQKDAVLSAIQKLERHNGCIIADSVGLGKTFSALAVIKYYELRNDKVLVLSPAKLYENWNEFRNNYKDSMFEEAFNYKLLFHTDLSRQNGESKTGIDLSRFDWGAYDLIVIDESHNFRNRVNDDETENRYSRLMDEAIKHGVNTKVLLLSATPVNNSLVDLKNQISLITKDKDDAFSDVGIPSVANVLKTATLSINTWNKQNKYDKDKENLFDMLPSDFYKLLENVTISRSRKHILEYYKNDKLGNFPKKLKPDMLTPETDIKGELLLFNTTNDLLTNLNLSIYTPMKFIKSEYKEMYSKKFQTTRKGKVVFKQENREDSVKQLHKFNLFKRLESSVYSFGETTNRLLKKIENFINLIENSKVIIDENNEELDGEFLDYKLEINVEHLNKDTYLRELEFDREILLKINKDVTDILENSRDNKLLVLKELLKNKIKNTPFNDGNQKVIVFTAFSDTARYLYTNLEEEFKKLGVYSGIVTGSYIATNNYNLEQQFRNVLRAFSPKSNKITLTENEQISILIGTDCISEGQNLQDCDTIINYDIHWNPVRLIQRFGRVDRIGSVNSQIKMINFFPNVELNEYLNLEARVKGKMQQMNAVTTGDENLLNPELNDISFRQKHLEKIKDEVVELEDAQENISLTDINMNEYLSELSHYIKKNQELKKTPRGIYSTVTSNEHIKGIIFCFKHKNLLDKPKSDSSLYPYYLIYVSETGEILYDNKNSRRLLKILRSLGLDKDEVDYIALNRFLEETKDTRDMTKVSSLLNKAIESIQGVEEKKAETSVFDFSGFLNKFENATKEDFELVSFYYVYE